MRKQSYAASSASHSPVTSAAGSCASDVLGKMRVQCGLTGCSECSSTVCHVLCIKIHLLSILRARCLPARDGTLLIRAQLAPYGPQFVQLARVEQFLQVEASLLLLLRLGSPILARNFSFFHRGILRDCRRYFRGYGGESNRNCAPLYVVHKYLPYRLNHDNQLSNGGPKVPQAHTRHHHHLRLAELVWSACLEAADVPYALTP